MLVVLGGFDALVALVLDDGLANGEPAVLEVDVGDPQAGEFTPAQAAVGQREYEHLISVV